MYPTPSAAEGFGRRKADPNKKRTNGLQTIVAAMYPTPRIGDATGGTTSNESQRRKKRKLVDVFPRDGGPLNPRFVEWLMGWPIGWTDLEPLATDRFQLWLEKHGCG
jgi:DNA (cytosine-5)-methyltransferase 1